MPVKYESRVHSRVDLNLFLVLVTIYRERTITAAAQQLSLTQPAVSHALNRLRDMLDDPLFERCGRKMEPTLRCHQIMPQVQQSIDTLSLSVNQPWLPNTSSVSRIFSISVSPVIEWLLLDKLQEKLKRSAPHISLCSKEAPLSALNNQLSGGELDLAVATGLPTTQGIMYERLCDSSFFALCRPDHPFAKRMTLSAYITAEHVLVTENDNDHSYVDVALARAGYQRSIRTQCRYFQAAAELALHSDMILTLSQAHVKAVTSMCPLVALPLPFAAETLPLHIYWHTSRDKDSLVLMVRQWVSDIICGQLSGLP